MSGGTNREEAGNVGVFQVTERTRQREQTTGRMGKAPGGLRARHNPPLPFSRSINASQHRRRVERGRAETRGGRKKRSNGRGRPSTSASAGERRGAGKKRARREGRSTDFDAKRVRRQRSGSASTGSASPSSKTPPTTLPPHSMRIITLDRRPTAASSVDANNRAHKIDTEGPPAAVAIEAVARVLRCGAQLRRPGQSGAIRFAPVNIRATTSASSSGGGSNSVRLPRAPINLHRPLRYENLNRCRMRHLANSGG
uniref:Uncharacterized protein n=1 Tax=Plectus sambesii TaxID=2011161 RepID=A0A914V433_9BILA